MSGSRALEAARRRRAGGSSMPPPAPAPTPTVRQSQQQDASQQSKPTPLLMLASHNKILENLQEIVTDLNNKVEAQDTLVRDSIGTLALDDNNIEFFRQKIEKMEKHMSDIKKHVLKVQTFAMETNLQFIEIKKEFKQQQKQFADMADLYKEYLRVKSIEEEKEKQRLLDAVKENTPEITDMEDPQITLNNSEEISEILSDE